jgi:Metallo-peptidase family M12B Reprolysin-like
MSFAGRIRIVWLLSLAGLACDGGPSAPSSGTLNLSVLGLPTGSAAAVTITGPNGFSQQASATQSFTQLTPGNYTITASNVMVGSAEYIPSPPSQTVALTSSSGQANASVFYSQATGNLAVTITGLGTGSTAAVTVTGPGYSQDVPTTTTLAGLDPGSYTVTARDTVANGGTAHTASPNSQTVAVVANTTANASVSYTPPPSDGSVNLRVAGLYLTQSTQTYEGSVPLVKDRNGYLRVFVVADRANTVLPAVKVRYYSGIAPVDSVTILPPPLSTSTPTAVDESSLRYSWNVPVPASRIQTGLSVSAEVNPTGAVAETNLTDNTYPALGPLALDVRTVPALNVTFVPVLQRGIPLNRRVRGNITDGNKDQFLETTRKMHPIAAVNAIVHADYTTTTTDTLQRLNGNNAWSTILREIDVLRIAEQSSRYYYGVAKVSYSSGVAGVAYVSDPTLGSRPAALGWDHLPSGSLVAAHELGHNWARNHAPCGGPTGIDPQYPEPDGSTGTYGLDVATQTLEPPTVSDIMGYCDPKWIGEYTYRGVMNYLLSPSPPVMSGIVQPTLLVWGYVRNGDPVLEPAFQLNTRPSLPQRAGPYTLSGHAMDGSAVFTISFSPTEVADALQDQQNFAFAVPLTKDRAARLARIQVVGPGRSAVVQTTATSGQPGLQTDQVEARRVQGGGVRIRWNSLVHPMVMVRDSETGEVLSLARGGEVELPTSKDHLDLLMSNGVRSRLLRTRVTR